MNDYERAIQKIDNKQPSQYIKSNMDHSDYRMINTMLVFPVYVRVGISTPYMQIADMSREEEFEERNRKHHSKVFPLFLRVCIKTV